MGGAANQARLVSVCLEKIIEAAEVLQVAIEELAEITNGRLSAVEHAVNHPIYGPGVEDPEG